MVLRVLILTGAMALSACAGPTYVAGRRTAPAATAEHSEQRIAASGNVELLVQTWKPQGAARASVVVVHGLKDYGDRYADFARALAEHGYQVWALDLRGHGDSSGRRVWVEAFDEYVDDVELVMKRARLATPGKPVFLFGHSMGGAVATLYTLNRTPEPAGLLLSGAALKTNVGGVQVVAVKLFSSLAPLLALFELDDSKFSRDASVVAAMKKDPLIYDGAAPVRTAAQVLTAIERIEGHCQELRVPLLAMHGSDDEVTPPEGSKALVACARSRDKTFKSYDGLYHDLLHEPEKAQVTADVLQWLDAHTR